MQEMFTDHGLHVSNPISTIGGQADRQTDRQTSRTQFAFAEYYGANYQVYIHTTCMSPFNL